MATYKVTHKDGREFELEGPAGASEQEVISALQSKLQREEIDKERADYRAKLAERAEGATFAEEPEDTDNVIENIYKGIWTGFVHGLETGAIGFTEPLGEETQQSARDTIRKFADAVKPELANPEAVTTKLAQGIGSFASLIPAALTGPVAIAAVPAMAAAMGVGEASERARAAGATPEERTKAAALGIAPGLLDVIPLARVSRKFAPALSDVVSKIGPRELSNWKSRIQRAAVTGGIEGAQETAQGLLQNAIEKGVYNPDRGIITGEAFEEGAVGFGAGAIIQGLLDAFVGRKRDFPEEGPDQGELFPETDLGAPPEPTLPFLDQGPPTASQAAQLAAGRTEEARREQVTEEEAEYAQQKVIEEVKTREEELNKLSDREQQEEAERIFWRNVDQYRQTRAAEQPDLFPVSPEVAAAARTDEGRQPDLFEALGTPTAPQREAEPVSEQLDLFPPEEQRVQAAAREREGLRAAERDDVAAFEQPDLFALEQEQERRRLGDPPYPADQFMGTLEGEELALEMTRRRVRERLGREPTAEEVASERAIDDPAWAIEREAAAAREPRQLEIEDEIAFQQELEAEETARAAEAPIPDTRRERVAAREAQDIARGEQTRGELPGLGRVATRAEAPPPALPVTAATLAGIPKSTPTYKQLVKLGKEGKDTSDPEVRRILEDHQKRINNRKPSKRNTEQLETIQNLLTGFPETLPIEETTDETGRQLTLFDTPDTGAQPEAGGGRGGVRGTVPGRQASDVATTKEGTETPTTGLGRTTPTATGTTGRERKPDAPLTPATPTYTGPTPEEVVEAQTSPATDTLSQKIQAIAANLREGRTAPAIIKEPITKKAATTKETRTTKKPPTKKATTKKPTTKTRTAPATKKGAATTTKTRTAPATTKKATTVTDEIRAKQNKAKADERTLKITYLPEGTAAGADIMGGRTSRRHNPKYRDFIGKVSKENEKKVGEARENARKDITLPKKLEDLPPETRERLEKSDIWEGTIADEWPWFHTETSYGGHTLLLEEFPDLGISDLDTVEIIALLRATPQTKDNAYDAKGYFSKYKNPRDNVLLIIWDSVSAPPINKPSQNEDPASELFIFETGNSRASKALDWMRKNLSAETNTWITLVRDNLEGHNRKNKRIVDGEDITVDVTEVGAPTFNAKRAAAIQKNEQDNDAFFEARNEDQILADRIDHAEALKKIEEAKKLKAKRKNAQRESDSKIKDSSLKLRKDAVVNLDVPLHPTVRNSLKKGNLQEALGYLASTAGSPRLSKLAAILGESNEAGTTKIEIVNNLKDKVGKRIPSVFHPDTNTIQLDSELGMNAHAVLHETTHALTSHILDNKSHPLTKQLNTLYNEAKGRLDTAYGAQDIHEFAAEAFSNVEFQQKLAGMRPKNSSVSLLRSFYRSISNMLRRLMGMQTDPSILDKTDNLIFAMLSPAPNSRNAGSMYMRYSGQHMDRLLDNIRTMGKSFPKLTPERREKFSEDFVNFAKGGAATPKAKEWTAKIAPLQALTDVAKHFEIPSAFELLRTIEKQVGAQGRAERLLDVTVNLTANWFKAHPDMKKTFDEVVYTSTRWGVNPNKPKSTYLDKDGKPTEKSKKWDDLKPKWGQLKSTGGDKVYLRMLRTYEKQFEQLKAVITSRIDNMKDGEGNPISKTEREKLKTNIFEKLFQKGRIDPYFPLTRKGEFWLEFQGVDSLTGQPEMVYMAFENPTARKKFVEQIKTFPEVDNKTIKKYEKLKKKDINTLRSSAPATSFMSQTLQVLRANNVSGDVQMEFMNLFLNALPESSFAKSLTRRANDGMGRAGFLEDALLAFRTKAYDLSSATVRLKYGAEINQVEAQLEEEYNTLTRGKKSDPDREYGAARIVVDELKQRAEFARNPPPDRLPALANRLAFMGTIGWNVSSALVNASQVPLFMQPILGGKYGQAKAASALINAGRIIGNSQGWFAEGGAREISTFVGDEVVKQKGSWSIDNYFTEDTANEGSIKIREDVVGKLPPDMQKQIRELQPLVQIALDRGQLNRSLHYDTLSLDITGREKGVWDWISASSAWMFHHVERYNRQIALVSTYQLELDRLKKEHGNNLTQKQKDDAANLALYTTQEMNGGAFLATAPGLAQSNLGRVAMMYKTYGIQMYYTILKTGRTFFMKDLPAHWVKEGYAVGTAKAMGDVAFKQFVGVMVSNVALAGVQGLPFIGILMALFNQFLPEDGEDAETILRKVVNEGWWKGGLVYGSEWAGVGTDIATRIGMGNLIFRMNPYARNEDIGQILLQAAGGPAWSVGKQFASGAKRAIDGEVWRGTESMLPAAARNIMKMERYRREGIRTQRHDVIYDDITIGNLIMQFFGFPPSEYTRRLEENLIKKGIERDIIDQRKGLLREYWTSVSRHDYGGQREIVMKMKKFNKKHPYGGVVISGKTLVESMRSHAKATATMYAGVQIQKGLRGLLRENYFDRAPMYTWWTDDPKWIS